MTGHWTYELTSALTRDTATLGRDLRLWARRDDTKPQPEIRQAANTAVDAIDRMLAELHRVREQLLGEIRESDDATMARAGALLAQVLKDRAAYEASFTETEKAG